LPRNDPTRRGAVPADEDAAEGNQLRDQILKVAASAGPTLDVNALDEEVISKAKCVQFIHYPNRPIGVWANQNIEHFDVKLFPALIFMRKGATPEAVVSQTNSDLRNVTDQQIRQYKDQKLDPISKPGAVFTQPNAREGGLDFNCASIKESNWRRTCKRTVREVTVPDPTTGQPTKKYLVHETSAHRYSLTGFQNPHHNIEMYCL